MKKNNLYEELLELLKEQGNGYFDSDGRPLKQKIIEEALKLEPKVIKAVLKNEKLKKHFTVDVSGITVFDKVKFQRFVSNKMYLSDSYTQFLNKMGLVDPHGELLSKKNDVVLVWPYKDCVLQGGQTKEDDKRNEIFYNEILAYDEITRLCKAKAFCNFKYIDKDGEKNFKSFPKKPIIENNFIIKGNNLLALHSLEKVYKGKIKLIYIDPPYNTGNDGFKYNDSFNHSTWLTFMKNRLQVARELLRDDGCIFVQCDDNEQAYLKVLMDEIFGRENFVNTIIMKTINPNGIKTSHAKSTILKVKEQILVFKKKRMEFNPQFAPAETYDNYYNLFIEGDLNDIKNCNVIKLEEKIKQLNILEKDLKNEKFKSFIIENADRIFQTKFDQRVQNNEKYKDGKLYVYEENPNYWVYKKRFGLKLSKTVKEIFGRKELSILLGDVWDDFKLNNLYLEGDVDFSNAKKPEFLLSRILDLTTDPNDIVLDFHLGSGTTCAVAHKMGRRYIGIEQMDYIENISIERMKKVIAGEQGGISKAVKWKGGGSFIYMEIKKQNEEWIDKIDAAETKEELFNLWNGLKNNVYLSYKVKPENVDESKEGLGALNVPKFKDFLLKVLDKNALYLNYSDIEDKEMKLSDNEKYLNWEFYEEEM